MTAPNRELPYFVFKVVDLVQHSKISRVDAIKDISSNAQFVMSRFSKLDLTNAVDDYFLTVFASKY